MIDPMNVREFALWHRLASESLVYVADRRDPSRDHEMLDTATMCENRAKNVAVNSVQEELADGLLAAVESIRRKLQGLPPP